MSTTVNSLSIYGPKRILLFTTAGRSVKPDSNKFAIPQIGFSDDDLRNLEKVKGHFKDDPENILKMYSTAGGVKKTY